MNLRDLQIAIKNFITDQHNVNFDAAPIEGLNIHKMNYFSSLNSALENKFPTTLNYLKNKEDKCIYKFIIANPSYSPNLTDYGENLPKFLKNINEIIAFEIATLDLSIYKSINSPLENKVEASKLAHITSNDFDRLKFRLGKSLHLNKISRKSFKLWADINNSTNFYNLNFDTRSHYLCIAISCNNNQVIPNIVSPSYLTCLKSLNNNDSLLTAIYKAQRVDPKFNLKEFLTFCFEKNIIADYLLS